MSLLPLPSAGETLSGKYVVGRTLGEGGMGVVYEVEHKLLGQRCALKLLRPEIARNSEAVARFDREARAAASLASRHVCRVTDVGAREDGTPYMVMEYLEGETLGARIERGDHFAIDEIVRIMLETCEAIDEAHRRRIIHRDLKPENLFLAQSSGGRTSVKVLDFGISKKTEDEAVSVTRTQSSIGTPLYMSPEQTRSSKHVDARTDVWALGVILYELLTGQVPFKGDTPTQVAVSVAIDKYPPVRSYRPEVPDALEEIVATALAKAPEDRFPTVRAFAAALAPFAAPGTDTGWIADGPPVPPPSSRNVAVTAQQSLETATTLNVKQEPGERRRAPLGWIVGAIGVVVIAIGAGAVFFGREPSTSGSTDSRAVGEGSGSARPADDPARSSRPTAEVSPAGAPASAEPSASASARAPASAAPATIGRGPKPTATATATVHVAPPPLTATALPTRL